MFLPLTSSFDCGFVFLCNFLSTAIKARSFWKKGFIFLTWLLVIRKSSFTCFHSANLFAMNCFVSSLHSQGLSCIAFSTNTNTIVNIIKKAKKNSCLIRLWQSSRPSIAFSSPDQGLKILTSSIICRLEMNVNENHTDRLVIQILPVEIQIGFNAANDTSLKIM